MAVPDGYSPYLRKSPLIEPWEPLYSKQLPDRVVIGLEVRRVHCNSRGLVHGGLISALADNAMGLYWPALQLQGIRTVPTCSR